MNLKNLFNKSIVFNIEVFYDTEFWAILPAINLNLHSKTLEFEWLCFGIYIDAKCTTDK